MNFDRGLEPSDAEYEARQDLVEALETHRELLSLQIENEIERNPKMAAQILYTYVDKNHRDDDYDTAIGILALGQIGLGHVSDTIRNMYESGKKEGIDVLVDERMEEE